MSGSSTFLEPSLNKLKSLRHVHLHLHESHFTFLKILFGGSLKMSKVANGLTWQSQLNYIAPFSHI
jgi:hypothetical protein